MMDLARRYIGPALWVIRTLPVRHGKSDKLQFRQVNQLEPDRSEDMA
jgi:hypothetical protein